MKRTDEEPRALDGIIEQMRRMGAPMTQRPAEFLGLDYHDPVEPEPPVKRKPWHPGEDDRQCEERE